jgi:hypothetical protein
VPVPVPVPVPVAVVVAVVVKAVVMVGLSVTMGRRWCWLAAGLRSPGVRSGGATGIGRTLVARWSGWILA